MYTRVYFFPGHSVDQWKRCQMCKISTPGAILSLRAQDGTSTSIGGWKLKLLEPLYLNVTILTICYQWRRSVVRYGGQGQS